MGKNNSFCVVRRALKFQNLTAANECEIRDRLRLSVMDFS